MMPHWLVSVASVFPVRHLSNALLRGFEPHVSGMGFAGRDLLIMLAWAVACTVIAVRRFAWEPRSI
jgi:hypothetical protein